MKRAREDTMHALENLNKELCKDIITLDDEVDRFSLYTIRQLKAAVQNERVLRDIGLSSPRDSLGYRVIAKSVERVADHAVKIAQDIVLLDSEVGEPSFKRISDLSLFAQSVFDDAIKSLFKKDYSLADTAVSKAKTIVSMETEALKVISRNVEPTQLSSIRIIMESIRRTAEYAGDIAEIVLNLNVNQVTET